MSFQFIIDNASSITIDTRATVASTVTRSGVTRSTVRNHQPWVITVEFPTGPRWVDYRRLIAEAERFDRHTVDTINFGASDLDWMFFYQGDGNISTQLCDYTAGFDTVNITGGSPTAYRARAGDFVQLGNYVYKVVDDTAVPSTQVKLHRPVIESGSGTVKWGQNCEFRVKCVEFPNPVIFARNQVGFEGAFRFVEVID